ncbi:MAG TPA: NnrS family protein, partial [Burkholderiales bacterium]|nr:NnrS family protein [Burkholderiales bacterium]
MEARSGSGNGVSGFALFNLGFRPFYLLAALLAAAGVPIWLAQFTGLIGRGAYLSGLAWHAHELIFGFAVAVIVGFLFTAARNWTNLPTPTGGLLAALAGLWLAGRVLVYTGPGPLAAAVDIAFLPAAALALWFPLYRSRNRNLFFVGLLLLFAAANLAFHLAHSGVIQMSAHAQIRFALYLVVLIVTIMGGRVI